MKQLEEYIRASQKQLFNMLFNKYEDACAVSNQYILVPGDAPVMLVAHLDTVHMERVKYICRSNNGDILMSPQGIGGDDRCGVYALNAVYERAAEKPWLLFTCDEEIGCIGANTFCKHYDSGKIPHDLSVLKLIIEIDRKGANDAVFYDCDNAEFEKYINSKGFVTSFGSFSDISYVAPAIGAAAVNLSSGYYNAHTQHEYIVKSELEHTIQRVIEIVNEAASPEFPRYEYMDAYSYFEEWDQYNNEWWYKYNKGKEAEKSSGNDDLLLSHVPQLIRSEYRALSSVYSIADLEHMRKQLGDAAIIDLCRAEFGHDYYYSSGAFKNTST